MNTARKLKLKEEAEPPKGELFTLIRVNQELSKLVEEVNKATEDFKLKVINGRKGHKAKA